MAKTYAELKEETSKAQGVTTPSVETGIQRTTPSGRYSTYAELKAAVPPPSESQTFAGDVATRSFFEDFNNLGQFYNNIQRSPAGFEFPIWMDTQGITTAFNALTAANGTPDWTMWQPLPEISPVRDFLKTIAEPPIQYRDKLTYNNPAYMDFMFGIKPSIYEGTVPTPPTPPPTGITGLPQEPSLSFNYPVPDVDYSKLPAAHKLAATILSSPVLTSLANMSPMAARGLVWAGIGTVIGGGPQAGIIAAATAMGLGLAFGVGQDPRTYKAVEQIADLFFEKPTAQSIAAGVQNWSLKGLYYLDAPAQWTEQSIGTSWQLYDLRRQGKLDKFLNAVHQVGLRQAIQPYWQAGTQTYEALSTVPGVSQVVQNVPYALEFLVDTVAGGVRDERWATKPGQVVQLGTLEPVQLDMYGMALLHHVRDSVLTRDNPYAALLDFQHKMGLGAVVTDLGLQIVADPLNFVPGMSRAGLGMAADFYKNPFLKTAVEDATPHPATKPVYNAKTDTYRLHTYKTPGLGAIGVWKTYKDHLFHNYVDPKFRTEAMKASGWEVPDYDGYTWFQHKIGQVDAAGNPVRITAETPKVTFSPISWVRYMNALSGESKADFMEKGFHNLINTALARNIDFTDTIREIESLFNTTVAEDVGWIKEVGLVPEWQAVKNAIRNAKPEVTKLLQDYRDGIPFLITLNDIGELMGEKPVDLINTYLTKTGMGVEALMAKVTEMGAPPELALRISNTDLKAFAKHFQSGVWNETFLVDKILKASYKKIDDFKYDTLKVSRNNPFKEAWAVGRSMQALLLFAGNPAWMINNIINNVATRTIDHNFRFGTSKQISEALEEWGLYVPSVYENFVGTELLSDAEFKSQVDAKNETRSTFMHSLSNSINKLTSYSPIVKASWGREKVDSLSSFYNAFDNYMGSRWIRGKDLQRMSPELEQEFLKVGGKGMLNMVYVALENAKMSKQIDLIRSNLGAAIAQRTMNDYIASAAESMGVPHEQVANIVRQAGVQDMVNRWLKAGIPFEDAINNARETWLKHSRERVMNDLVVRAHDIAHRVDAQGIMEFVSLWTDLTMSEEVMQTMHSQKLNDMWEEIREFGGHWRSHDAIFERYDHAFDIDWQNYNDWAVATSNGVFRALGFLDPNDNTKLNPVAQDYVVSLLNYHTEAKAFFEFRKQAINKFKNGHYQGDVAATKWHEMMVDIMNRYDTLQTTQLQMTQRMSNDLLRLYMDQYKNLEGYENGLKVMKRYVDFTVQLAHRRQNLMRDMRAWELSGDQADLRTEEMLAFVQNRNRNQRQKNWNDFMAQIYLRQQAEGIGRFFDDSFQVYEALNMRPVEGLENINIEYRGDIPPEYMLREFERDMQLVLSLDKGVEMSLETRNALGRVRAFVDRYAFNDAQRVEIGDAHEAMMALAEQENVDPLALDAAQDVYMEKLYSLGLDIRRRFDQAFEKRQEPSTPQQAEASQVLQEQVLTANDKFENWILAGAEGAQLTQLLTREQRVNAFRTIYKMSIKNAEVQNKILETMAEVYAERHRGKTTDDFYKLVQIMHFPDTIPAELTEYFAAQTPPIEDLPFGFYHHAINTTIPNIISAVDNNNAVTFLHESAHLFYHNVLTNSERTELEVMLVKAYQFEPARTAQESIEEMFAKSYTRWRIEDGDVSFYHQGTIRKYFERFRNFMRKVIAKLTRDYNVSEEFWLGTVKDETALTELETFYRQLFDRKIEEYTPNEWMTLDQDHYLVRGTLPESAARRKIYRDRAWAMYNRKYAIPQHLIDYHPKLKSRIKLDGTTRPLPEYGNDFFTIEDVHPLLSPAPPRDTPGWQRFKGRMSGKLRLPDGEPYVLYHGTGNAGFAEFDPERFNPFAMWNAGIYLTDSPEVAGGIGDWQLDVERYKTRAEAEQAGFVGDYEIEQDEAGAWIMRKNRFVRDESGYVMTGMYNLIVPESDRPRVAEYFGTRRQLKYLKKIDPYHYEEAMHIIRDFNETGSAGVLRELNEYPYKINADYMLEEMGYSVNQGVYPVYASLANPIDLDEVVTSYSDINKILRQIGDYDWHVYRLAGLPPSAIRNSNIAVDMTSELNKVEGDITWADVLKAFRYGLENDARRLLPNIGERSLGELRRDINSYLGFLGYDGLLHTGGRVSGIPPHQVVVAFYPGDVKSVFNGGDFNREKRNLSLLRQPAIKDVTLAPIDVEWDFKTLNEINGSPIEKMPAKQWLNYLRGRGVKDVELAFLGLDTLLIDTESRRAITRPEILQHILDNSYVVRTLTYEGHGVNDSLAWLENTFGKETMDNINEIMTQLEREIFENPEDKNLNDKYDAASAFYKQLVDLSYTRLSGSSADYSRYTIPGGRNYSDRVITVRNPRSDVDLLNSLGVVITEKKMPDGTRYYEARDTGKRTSQYLSQIPVDTLVDVDYETLINRLAAMRHTYVEEPDIRWWDGSHWFAKNVLTHARTTDRYARWVGKPFMFVEELQSDRARDIYYSKLIDAGRFDKVPAGWRAVNITNQFETIKELNIPESLPVYSDDGTPIPITRFMSTGDNQEIFLIQTPDGKWRISYPVFYRLNQAINVTHLQNGTLADLIGDFNEDARTHPTHRDASFTMWRDENDNLQGFRWVSPIDIVGFARTYETAEDAIRDLVNMPRYRRAYEIRDANNNVIETIRDSKIISEEAMLWQFLQDVVVDNPMANTWHEIAAKQLIHEAVREGKPAIAFTDAETQIRRWNTDAYYWTRQSDGSVVVSGRLAMSDIEDAIELSNRNIDNETAKRIISYIDLRGGYSRNLFRFADLTFRDVEALQYAIWGLYGHDQKYAMSSLRLAQHIFNSSEPEGYIAPRGEFMVTLYDKKMPSFLQKYAKKIGATYIDAMGIDTKEGHLRPENMRGDWGERYRVTFYAKTKDGVILGDDMRPSDYGFTFARDFNTEDLAQEALEDWVERGYGYWIRWDKLTTSDIIRTGEINVEFDEPRLMTAGRFKGLLFGEETESFPTMFQRKPDSHFFQIGATGLKPTPEDLDLFNQYLGNKRPAFYQGAVDHIIPLEPENILNTFDDVWDVFVGGGFTGTAIVGKAESMRKHMNLHMSDLDPAVINLHNSVKIDERNAALLARLDSWEKFVTDLHLAFRDANGVVQPPNPVVSRYANLILGKMNQNIKHQQPIYNWTGIENNLRELYALEPRLAGVALPASVPEPQMDLSLWNDLAFLELWTQSNMSVRGQNQNITKANGNEWGTSTEVNPTSKGDSFTTLRQRFGKRTNIMRKNVVEVFGADAKDTIQRILAIPNDKDVSNYKRSRQLVLLDPPFPPREGQAKEDTAQLKRYFQYSDYAKAIMRRFPDSLYNPRIPPDISDPKSSFTMEWALNFINNEVRALNDARVPFIYFNNADPEIISALNTIPGVRYVIYEIIGTQRPRLELAAYPGYIIQNIEARTSDNALNVRGGLDLFLSQLKSERRPVTPSGMKALYPEMQAQLKALLDQKIIDMPVSEQQIFTELLNFTSPDIDGIPSAASVAENVQIPFNQYGDYSVVNLPMPFRIGDNFVNRIVMKDGQFVAYQWGDIMRKRAHDIEGRKVKLLGLDDTGQWVFDVDGEIVKQSRQASEADALGQFAPGTVDSVIGQYPFGMILNDGYQHSVEPVMNAILREYKRNPSPVDLTGDISKIDPRYVPQFNQYLDQQKINLDRLRVSGVDYGLMMRNAELLNYREKANIDNMLSLGLPYGFWMTHQLVEWALRIMDRPAIMANFLKIAKLSNRYPDNEDDKPSRLKGLWDFNAPWQPEWAGRSLWVNPLTKILPLNDILRPFEQLQKTETRLVRNAEATINKWYYAGAVPLDEAKAAIQTHTGTLWDQAYAEASTAEGTDFVDWVSAFSSPALWLTMPYKIATGQAEELNPLPMSRTIQGLATALGMDKLRLLDLEAHIRKNAGLSEFGEWGNYYVDRQLVNLAIENPQFYNEIYTDMVNKSGQWYEQAYQRVQFEMMMRQPGIYPFYAGREDGLGGALGSMVFGWLPSGMLPEAELKARGLYDQYKTAAKAYNSGDLKAFDNFFAKYPEYQVRMALFEKPEERMHQFLTNSIWDAYSRLPTTTKEQVQNTLGDAFINRFLPNIDTESITNETLAKWAHYMAGNVPLQYKDMDAPVADLPPMEVSQIYQKYVTERDTRYPGINDLQTSYYNSTEEMQAWILDNTPLAEYWNWKDRYLADNLDLVPYMVSEDSRLAGVDPELAKQYYIYRAEFHSKFPNYYDDLDIYYDSNKTTTKQSLRDAWAWKDKQLKALPALIPLVETTPAGVTRAMKFNRITPQEIIVTHFDPALRDSLYNYNMFGDPLGAGSMAELLRIYSNTDTNLDFDEWLKSISAIYKQ